MEYIIAGLGNPGSEYENTRHNVGRMVVVAFAEEIGASEWRDDKKLRAQVAQGALPSGEKVRLVLPDNYMNRSGGSLVPLIKSKKAAARLVVVHDDIDLPLGTIRIVFDRGAGGHRGVESIVRALNTKAFIRIRVGVLPVTPSGKPKKPQGGQRVYDFILKQLAKREREAVVVVVARAREATAAVVQSGCDEAMRTYNAQTRPNIKKRTRPSTRTRKA